MQNAGPSEILLVLGMHRSGTSALTRCMNLLGYAAPKTLIKSNKRNLSGHWESEPIARLNDEFMALGELTWHDWKKGSLDRLRARDQRDFGEDLIATLASEFPEGQPCVLKGPRICRLMPYYRAALEAQKTPVRVIIPVRNPLEVMRSLSERNEMEPVDASLLWLRYVLDAVAGSQGMDRAFIAYDKFLEDPVARLSAVEEHLGSEYPIRVDAVSDQITEFLEPGLRHHTFSTIDVAHDPLTEVWVNQAYAALLVLCEDPDSNVALDTLARIRDAFDQSSDILSTVSSGYKARESELKSQLALAEQSSAEHVALEERFETVQQALLAVETELDENRVSAEQLKANDDELAAAQMESIGLSERLAAVQQALSEEKAKVDTTQASDASTDRLRAKFSNDLAIKTQLVERQNFQLVQSEKRRKKSDVDLGDVLSRLKIRERELRQLNRQFWRLKDELKWSKEIVRAYEGSTSWKITSPMRKIIRLVRGTGSVAPAPEAYSPAPIADVGEAETIAIPVSTPRSEQSKVSEVGILEKSAEFDKAYYLSHYPEAQLYPDGAEAHFLEIGWKKGLKPSATFETKAYLASHPELVSQGICPLIHFIEAGAEPRQRANGASSDTQKRGGRVAVFMAISNGYDDIKEPEIVSDNADYFVFTDGDVPEGSVWQALPFEFVSNDPTRTARFVKTHPHLYFKEYDWAIWVDANLMLTCAPEDLLPSPSSSDKLLTWSHPLRDCVYDEGEECIKRSKDSEGIIGGHMASLKQRNFPRKAGLFETSVVVSKMGDAQVEEVFNVWWAEISRWSRRDQLSLPVAINALDFQVGLLARERICMRTDPRFVYFGHAGR